VFKYFWSTARLSFANYQYASDIDIHVPSNVEGEANENMEMLNKDMKGTCLVMCGTATGGKEKESCPVYNQGSPPQAFVETVVASVSGGTEALSMANFFGQFTVAIFTIFFSFRGHTPTLFIYDCITGSPYQVPSYNFWLWHCEKLAIYVMFLYVLFYCSVYVWYDYTVR